MSTTGVLPPPVGPRGLALRCALEGKAAGLEHHPHTACPYRVGRPFSQRAWLLGYVAGRQAAGTSPELDVDEDVPWPGDELDP